MGDDQRWWRHGWHLLGAVQQWARQRAVGRSQRRGLNAHPFSRLLRPPGGVNRGLSLLGQAAALRVNSAVSECTASPSWLRYLRVGC